MLHTSRFNLLGTAAIVACCLGCGSNGSSGSNGDPALVGTWTGTEMGYASGSWTFVITATTLEVQSSGGEGYKTNYTADTSADPKRLTATITECSAVELIGKASKGIYKIEGTTMTFAANIPGSTDFPTAFAHDSIHQTRAYTLSKQ